MTTTKTGGLSHEKIETSNFLMIVLTLIVLAIGGIVEIVPLFFQASTTQPIEGVKPLTAMQLVGRDIYVREGCYNCHSQMIRPFRAEILRYGHYSVAGESVYDHPFQWGSKRTGPDLARVGGKYSDDWQMVHLNNPRDVVPESNMPAYPWLATTEVDHANIGRHMAGLRTVGVPYSDEEIAKAGESIKGKTEQQALVAYLQSLGLALSGKPSAAALPVAVPAAAPAAEAAPAAAPAAAPTAAAAEDTASATLENGVAKFYFATAKADLAKDANAALKDAIAAAKDGKSLKISGYHDAKGDPARNAELAKNRALAVRAALIAQGVKESAIEMVKPEQAQGSGSDKEARRVEVVIK